MLENRILNSSSRDDADSGVICPDVADNVVDDDIEDEDGVKALDSLKQSSDIGSSRRVYLNHRNITKMKDIKYKRITKTKSKSLEELRDKLRDSPFALSSRDQEGSEIGFSYA